MKMRYDSTPKLRAWLKDCPPGSTVPVRVVEMRVVVLEPAFPTAPPEQVLVVVYDLAPFDAPEQEG